MYVRYDVLIRRLRLDEPIDDDVLYFPGQRAAGGEGESGRAQGAETQSKESNAARRDTRYRGWWVVLVGLL
jgi:hypothetical protein